MTVSVTIPGCPADSYSPNSRTHWAVKAREGRACKEAAMWSCVGKERVSGPVRIVWGIHLAKGRRKRDTDNVIAALKPFLDGIVTAGLIDADTPEIVREIQVVQFPYREHGIPGGEIDCTVIPV